MASINLQGDTSGSISISAPSVAGSNTLTLPASTQTLATQNSLGVRNLIINGDMRIAQRGTSFTGLSNEYGLDRWKANLDLTGAATASQDTDVPSGQGFSYSQKVQVTTAVTYATTQQAFIEQLIEAQNITHLSYGSSSAKSLTVSFWVKSNVTGTFIVWVHRDDDGRSISKSYTINTADTWEKKTITVEGDTSGSDIPSDNGVGFRIRFLVDAGPSFDGTLTDTWQSVPTTGRYAGQSHLYTSTSNYINITGVQLEVGTEATPFEHRPYDMELARCQRYYEVMATGYLMLAVARTSDYIRRVGYQYKVTKRANPTITITSQTPDGASTINAFTPTVDNVDFNTSGGASAIPRVNAFTMDAEL